MKYQLITVILIYLLCTLSCTQQKTIELPLTQQKGYGYFNMSLSGASPYSDDENNPWGKTYLKVSGVPAGWTDVKYGDIDTNILQSVYQNYLLGNITKERYEGLQKSWDWQPDTLELSKEPLKNKIAFAYRIDSIGTVEMIVDANNNYDFSDDESFIPLIFLPSEGMKNDSVAISNAIDVSFERFIDNKIVVSTAPLFITYMSQFNMLMCNFPQYSTTTFKGETIAVLSDNFTNLSYRTPTIALINDTLKEGDKLSPEVLISKNEYIEIKGNLYKNIGVDNNKNALILEKMDLPKSEMNSTQIGYKTYPFEGNDVVDESPISLDKLKGKYVLLDFWAVWCGTCREEIPNLKALYEKTDRDKFEIVGIVGDSPKDALLKIIETDSITWTQILSTDTNKIKEDYGIKGYPTTFLIDPNGVIVAKDLRVVELEMKVLELVKE